MFILKFVFNTKSVLAVLLFTVVVIIFGSHRKVQFTPQQSVPKCYHCSVQVFKLDPP